jgi:hypothetical protein
MRHAYVLAWKEVSAFWGLTERSGPAGRGLLRGERAFARPIKLRLFLPLVGINLVCDWAKRYTCHEVTAPRVVDPSGRTVS